MPSTVLTVARDYGLLLAGGAHDAQAGFFIGPEHIAEKITNGAFRI